MVNILKLFLSILSPQHCDEIKCCMNGPDFLLNRVVSVYLAVTRACHYALLVDVEPFLL